jgi:CDP-diglyceride synthetase
LALPGVIVAFLLLSAIMVVSHIALTIGVGFKEAQRPSDERERLIQLASQRNAGWVAIFSLWAIPWFALNPSPRLMVTYAALGLSLLGQIVMYGSELFYYRRGL